MCFTSNEVSEDDIALWWDWRIFWKKKPEKVKKLDLECFFTNEEMNQKRTIGLCAVLCIQNKKNIDLRRFCYYSYVGLIQIDIDFE